MTTISVNKEAEMRRKRKEEKRKNTKEVVEKGESSEKPQKSFKYVQRDKSIQTPLHCVARRSPWPESGGGGGGLP